MFNSLPAAVPDADRVARLACYRQRNGGEQIRAPECRDFRRTRAAPRTPTNICDGRSDLRRRRTLPRTDPAAHAGCG